MSASLFRRLSAFFGGTLDQDPKAAKYAVLIPGPGMFVNVRNAPRVVIAAPSGRPLFRRVSRLCEKLKNAMRNGWGIKFMAAALPNFLPLLIVGGHREPGNVCI